MSGGRTAKISSEFAQRLRTLGPKDKIRAILMIETVDSAIAGRGRQTAVGRAATIGAIRQSAEKALPRIDTVLRRHNGKRLSDSVDSLGSIPVETTAAGIKALADLEPIKVILEDQILSGGA